MCCLTGVSRASYYRHLVLVAPDEEKMAVRQAIQEIALAHHRRYGYRRVTKDLHRRGMIINHKRVLPIMREDNLLAIRYRKYILTTNSQHDCAVYVNLAARMTITSVDQLWVAWPRSEDELMTLSSDKDACPLRLWSSPIFVCAPSLSTWR